MTPAEELFNQTYARALAAWSTIAGFRMTLQTGIDAAGRQLFETAASLYRELVENPDYSKLLLDRDEFARTVKQTDFANASAAAIRLTTEASLEAASLVFAHSVVDAAAIDYCRVTALHAPRIGSRTCAKNRLRSAHCPRRDLTRLTGKNFSDIWATSKRKH